MNRKITVERMIFKIGVHLTLVMFILGVALLGVSKYGYGHGIDIIFGLVLSVLGFSAVLGLTNASIKFKLAFPVTVMIVAACGFLWYFIEADYFLGESIESAVMGIFMYMIVFGLVSLVAVLVGSLVNFIVNKIVKKAKSVKQTKKQQIHEG